MQFYIKLYKYSMLTYFLKKAQESIKSLSGDVGYVHLLVYLLVVSFLISGTDPDSPREK